MPPAPRPPLRVLTWNLYHGRARPSAGRDLEDEFVAALGGWAWDVALLQEVPPWWTGPIAVACGARAFAAPTSRNALPAARRVLARRWPDVVQAQGGGANVVLVRPRDRATSDATARRGLRWFRERRVVCGVRLSGAAWGGFDGTWIATTHAQLSVAPHPTAWADTAASLEAVRAWAGERGAPGDADARRAAWAATHRSLAARLPRAAREDRPADLDAPPRRADDRPPLVLGGDLNLRRETLAPDAHDRIASLPGWRLAGSSWLDHVLVRGDVRIGAQDVPDRGALSDHAPLRVALHRD